MHRAKLKSPMILFNCWRNFELCAEPNVYVRRRSAGLPSRRQMMVRFLLLLLLLMAFSFSLKPYHLQQVQPAQAQTSGEVLLQSPLWHLLYVWTALVHPRIPDVTPLISTPPVQPRLPWRAHCDERR